MTGAALPSSLRLPRLAVLGAGHTGPVIARVAMEAGYPVAIAASGDPEKIDLITKVLASSNRVFSPTRSAWTSSGRGRGGRRVVHLVRKSLRYASRPTGPRSPPI